MSALRDPRSSTVAVIGLGYVGLPLAVELGKIALRANLERAGVDAADVENVVLGQVLQGAMVGAVDPEVKRQLGYRTMGMLAHEVQAGRKAARARGDAA